jgi:hypothetical protein
MPFWPLRVFRELDDVLLRLRTNEPEIGTVVLKAEGDTAACSKPTPCSTRTGITGSSAK